MAVLFLSFRTVDGLTFEKAYAMLTAVIARAYQEHLYLLESEKVNSYEKEIFHQIADRQYAEKVEASGYRKVLRYGIAFSRNSAW